MLNKLIKYLTPNYNKLTGKSVFLILFLGSLFIRLPFFFRDYVDRDESTFILMAQSWVDGHLPYTELWDLKPPIAYLFFAFIIYLFGKSFITIRLIGTLAVAVIAFFTYKIGAEASTKKVGFWSAFLCVFLLSMFGSLQGVMSEHISMLFFVPALFLLIKYRTPISLFCTGILMGLAVMTKLNMAYAILFLVAFLLYSHFQNKKILKGIKAIVVLGMGTVLVILLTILPYYLAGKTDVWWNSIVLASLAYSNVEWVSIVKASPICILVIVFFFFCWKKRWLDFQNRKIVILMLACAGVLFSFLKSGRVNGHYLIQLHPMLIVLAGIAVSKITVPKKIDYRPYVLLLLLLLPIEAYLEYYNVVRNKIERGTFFNGEGFTVPKYITDHDLETENILFFEYHIGYWVLGEKPPTKAATHPSNICREEVFPFFQNPRKTGMEELRFIMEEIKPKTVITRSNRLVFDKALIEENQYINSYLEKHYDILDSVDKADIHKRLE